MSHPRRAQAGETNSGSSAKKPGESMPRSPYRRWAFLTPQVGLEDLASRLLVSRVRTGRFIEEVASKAAATGKIRLAGHGRLAQGFRLKPRGVRHLRGERAAQAPLWHLGSKNAGTSQKAFHEILRRAALRIPHPKDVGRLLPGPGRVHDTFGDPGLASRTTSPAQARTATRSLHSTAVIGRTAGGSADPHHRNEPGLWREYGIAPTGNTRKEDHRPPAAGDTGTASTGLRQLVVLEQDGNVKAGEDSSENFLVPRFKVRPSSMGGLCVHAREGRLLWGCATGLHAVVLFRLPDSTRRWAITAGVPQSTTRSAPWHTGCRPER